ncbi:MAG TPA: hypothetical protein H9694_04600 [Firmicutes bacterium]|nr:hypothetical protein [Bacillota bacterium]
MKKKSAQYGLAALLTAAAAGLRAAAEGASPATGEQTSPLPFIVAGAAVALLAAVVVLTILTRRKK